MSQNNPRRHVSAAGWVVRHAPAQVKGICYGQTNIPVEGTPETAARAILEQLEGPMPGEVWTSPWQRTQPVAEFVARALGVPLHSDARLSELSMGVWEGRSFDALAQEDPDAYWHYMNHWETAAPPGGETLSMFVARVDEWVCQVPRNRPLVVTHAGVIRVLRALHRRLPYRDVVGEAVVPLRVEPWPGGRNEGDD